MKWTMPPNLNGPGGNQQMMGISMMPSNEECGIRDVWCHNLEEEFNAIRQVVQNYPFVAMDTEFPGVVARPVGEFRSPADYHYQLLRCNVDLLRIIQLGLTFMDDDGKRPPGTSTWQFNFKFNLGEDMYAQDSIDLLQNSGIQFKKHEEDGIEPYEFAEMLMISGIVLVDNIKWLCFHSGYDFGYLLKLLTEQNLPADEVDFFELLRYYFPNIYDIKYLMKSCKNLKGGLQEVADQLEIRRLGPQHQAGSDALLTGMAFFKMREVYANMRRILTQTFDANEWSHFQYIQFLEILPFEPPHIFTLHDYIKYKQEQAIQSSRGSRSNSLCSSNSTLVNFPIIRRSNSCIHLLYPFEREPSYANDDPAYDQFEGFDIVDDDSMVDFPHHNHNNWYYKNYSSNEDLNSDSSSSSGSNITIIPFKRTVSCIDISALFDTETGERTSATVINNGCKELICINIMKREICDVGSEDNKPKIASSTVDGGPTALMFFEDNIDDAKYCGHLYGLGTTFVSNGQTFHDNASVVVPVDNAVSAT